LTDIYAQSTTADGGDGIYLVALDLLGGKFYLLASICLAEKAVEFLRLSFDLKSC
jgi:hypothetical protein